MAQIDADAVVRGLLGRWFRTVTVGEFLGFCVPTATFAATFALGFSDLAVLAAMVAAGIGEGAVLGWFQARVLRHVLPVSARRWTALTGAGGALAWFLGMLPSTFFATWSEWPPPVLVVLGVVVGLALLGSIGFAQWTELRRHVPGAGWWILATALAWGVGLGVFGAVTSPLWQPGQALVLVVAIGLVGGVCMAAAMALTTGWALRRLVARTAVTRPTQRG